MVQEFYQDKDSIILGYCSHLIYLANRHTDEYLNKEDTNNKWLQFYAEYLSLFIQITIRKAETKLAKKDCQYLIDNIFVLLTWLATEARGFFLDNKQKGAFLEEIRNIVSDRTNYYLEFPFVDSESGDEKKNSVIWHFSNQISKLDGSFPNLGAIMGNQIVAVNTLSDIKIDQFITQYNSLCS